MTSQRDGIIEAQFEKRLRELDKTLCAAKAHFDIAAKIDGYFQDHPAELDFTLTFWVYTRRAHLHAGVLAVAKLLEDNSDSLSLLGFLRFARNNPRLFSRELVERRQRKKRPQDSEEDIDHWLQAYKGGPDHKVQIERVEDVRRRLGNLDKWRDKVVAHIDKGFVNKGQPVGQVYPLQKSEVQSAITACEQVLGCYSEAYDMTSRDFSQSFVTRELGRIIEALEKWRSSKASG